MSGITIKRRGGWTDRFRAHTVKIDDTACGSIRANEAKTFDAEPGPHRVQLWIGTIYSSPVVTVVVGSRGTVMACGPNVRPGLAIFSLLQPGRWVALDVADGPQA